ncbi:RluA family pseudouridine synthase [Alkalicoccus halolimnae]|uniref:Pseudouridine synthase n=1 Tax=Alkalicoccus halolimnae TaxID=1667239 RepID=A0A5C7FCN0_9BACI|nr:RluA family pseudouridine synthase [Alkalicoccus halolimnae]TXF82529.1 RluA family pseudouridine synthase [Alkalicoccus halolimnae]
MKDKVIKLVWEVPASISGIMLREFLRVEKQVSRKLLAEVKFRGGKLEINEAEASVNAILKPTDKVTITLPAEDVSGNIIPAFHPLVKLYEDEHVLVIDKPPHLPVLPMTDRLKPSVSGAILYDYIQNRWPATVHIVTRLDRDTSGVMLIAKHRYAHSLLFAAQHRGEVRRSYRAQVKGEFPWAAVSIHVPIARKPTSNVEREPFSKGQKAVSHVKCLKKADISELRISLETGRTHQIRVHMNWLGFPVAGDTLYGEVEKGFSRQALHAEEIIFPHPISGEQITVSAAPEFT